MKNKSFIPLLGFILLLGVTSCTEPIEVNPNYNQETKEVTAQFVISVNTSSPQTKMKPDAVQQSSNFRGINDGRILLFKSYSGTTPLPYVLDPSQKADKDYPFGTLLSSGDITASENQESSSNRILQMSVPTGINAVLIYGIAPKEGAKNVQGQMDYYVSDTPNNTSFTLARRIGDSQDDITAYDHTGNLMAYVINRILLSNCAEITPPAPAYLNYTELPAISWRELGIIYENNNQLNGTVIPFGGVTATRSLTALEEALGRAYSEFTYIKDGEYRAGSSNAIKKMMQDMYSVVTSILNATPTNAAEANAQRLAGNIETRMNNYFKGNWEYKSISEIHTYIIEASLMDEDEWNNRFGEAEDLNNYPYGNFNIPEGAAQLKFDRSTGEMGYRHPNQALLNAGDDYDPRNYSYPVELAYCVNSPLRISSKSNLQVSDFVNGVNPWQQEAEWTNKGWNSGIGVVEQSTRGIAVRDNISYGVALLKTTLSYDETAPFENYADNRKQMTGEDDRTFSKSDAKLSLKGVLIGGQNNQMNWQFLRKNTTLDGNTYKDDDALIDPALFNHVIYDDYLNDAHVPTQAPNYTLVFDNYDSSDDDHQNTVKVALEFVNGGDAFWGKENLIPAGGTFYLVGELDPAHAKSGSTIEWDSATRQIPPIYLPTETIPDGKAAGDSKKIARVFIQDYMTIANFYLNANSLKKAYLSVPDLRSAQLSFGLSVDLKWKTGFEFDYTF